MSKSLKVKCIPLFFLVTVSTLIHHFRNKKGAVGNSGQQKKSHFQESSVKFKSQGKWLQNCLEVVRLFSNLGKLYGYENHTLRKCSQITHHQIGINSHYNFNCLFCSILLTITKIVAAWSAETSFAWIPQKWSLDDGATCVISTVNK